MKRAFFHRDGELFYDARCARRVPRSNPAYEVLRHVKIPAYLRDVVVYEQTYEQAQRGLVFVGVDSKGRKQYFYGKLHVQERHERRDRIFVRVFEVMRSIQAFVDAHLERAARDDVKAQLAVFLLMETSFYIRTGKVRYYRANETVGLLTLKNAHLHAEDGRLAIRFVGKDKVTHEFLVHEEDRLYAPLRRLHDPGAPDAFLFSRLSERVVYRCVRQFGVRVKDLRTYGVNVTFLRHLWANVKALPALPSAKKLVVLSIKQTAEAIGHSPGIARQAYMALTVLELAREPAVFESIREKSFEEFLALIVDYVKKQPRAKWTEV
ncbi:DNA topoisomerase type I [Equine molluscum contagiosum-like virus]|nr:DNA topoisomerase type I [Equine molluscum contagiosum-like virus]